MTDKPVLRLVLGYVLLALLLCFPVPFSGEVIGNPDIDVWNHLWGYWYWLDSFSSGALPWRTELLNAPDGGVLYFVDPVGAGLALPFSAIFGVPAAYTGIQLMRFTLAGLVSHFFCREIAGDGPHCWAAGIAFASSPFLLAEAGNGISEVTAVWWTPLCFWMAARAFRSNALEAWIKLGVAQGLCTLASFYYGLGTAILIATWWGVTFSVKRLKGTAVAAVLAVGIPLPFFAAFRASLGPGNPEAVIQRSGDLNQQLLAHNAVDPREYIVPGDFQSVDFMGQYGEAFIHTAYLRWSAILLAGWVVWRLRRVTYLWVSLVGLSLVLGLGRALWWNGEFVGPGDQLLILPFGWFQELIPQLAITHSSRLTVGGQAILAMLVGWSLVGQSGRRIALLSGILLAESLFLSSASWPLPRTSVEIPAVYEEIAEATDSRAVLDLPAEVGTTMASSKYFLYQTTHQKPIPYSPDIRAGSSSDRSTFFWLQHPRFSGSADFKTTSKEANGWVDRTVENRILPHLKSRYGWIILHREEAERVGVTEVFKAALERVLGEPEEEYPELWLWRL